MKSALGTLKYELVAWPQMTMSKNFTSGLKDFKISPSAWKPVGKATKPREVPVNNKDVLDQLNANKKGDWVKVYYDGVDAGGRPKSLHYFLDRKSGTVTDLKVHNNWSNGGK